MDGVACSGTFRVLSHRLRLAFESCFLWGYSAAFSWELGNVVEDTGAPLGPQAAVGPGNFLEGGNREVAETGMGLGEGARPPSLSFFPEFIPDSTSFRHYGIVMGATASEFPTHSSPSGDLQTSARPYMQFLGFRVGSP